MPDETAYDASPLDAAGADEELVPDEIEHGQHLITAAFRTATVEK